MLYKVSFSIFNLENKNFFENTTFLTIFVLKGKKNHA